MPRRKVEASRWVRGVADTSPIPTEPPIVTGHDGRMPVIVELAPSVGAAAMAAAVHARGIDAGGFALDEEFGIIPLGGGPATAGMGIAPASHVARGTVADEAAMAELGSHPNVVAVWRDAPVLPFMPCPITPCDCDPGTPKGTIGDVAVAIGVDQVWAGGHRGAGVIVGVVDGGITAQGRVAQAGQTPRRIPNVVGGWRPDWGTEALWSEHGNMCSTDVLGMAPDASLWDLRIADAPDIPGLLSNALGAFQWAINQQAATGASVVLTNSWGIFDRSSAPDYATNPNHPFSRKVVDAVAAGIVVLFAAGNCGEGCPDGRCATNGPGQGIWGANGHPQVITVGAVNKDGEWVGYSSEGPAALDPNKPDVCSITHFTGYKLSDNGTSAATPILAGACALLKQAHPAATTDTIKQALKATAQDIGPAGFDTFSGAGIVQIKAAYDHMNPIVRPSGIICQSTIICAPSVTCNLSRVTCGPSMAICVSVVTCASMSPACSQSSIACPSLACPSIQCGSLACTPGGGGSPGGQGFAAEQWGSQPAWYQGWAQS